VPAGRSIGFADRCARENPHGPLPPLLLLLTVVTGLVDAFSYLQFGHVFVANMTGNVVFLSSAVGSRTRAGGTAAGNC
jgi:Protein of unknown function (DUF1275)